MSAALQHRDEHLFDPQQALDAQRRTLGLHPSLRRPPPQPLAMGACGAHLFGGELQPQQRRARRAGTAPGEPPLELPPHAIGELGRRRRGIEPPGAGQPLPVLGARLDAQPSTQQATAEQPVGELFGQPARGKRGNVDPGDGRIKIGLHRDIGLWTARVAHPELAAAGQGVSPQPPRTKAGGHVTGGQRCEGAERAQPEPMQPPRQLTQLLPPLPHPHAELERLNAMGSEEGGRLTDRHRLLQLGGQQGGEQAFADPHLTLRAAVLSDLTDDKFGQALLAAGVANGASRGEEDDAGPQYLYAGSHLLDPLRHGLKVSRVAVLIGCHQHELGAHSLGAAAPHSAAHSLATRGGRTDENLSAVVDGHRLVGCREPLDDGGGNGPIGHPHGHAARRHDIASHHDTARNRGRPSSPGETAPPSSWRPAPSKRKTSRCSWPPRSRPPARSSTRRSATAPQPCPSPVACWAWATSWRSLPGRLGLSSTAPRLRSRARTRRRSPSRRCRPAPSTTTPKPSRMAATTSAARAPGEGTTTVRCRATPASAAAGTPRWGNPTRAIQRSCAIAAAPIASSNEFDPRTSTVLPGRNPAGSTCCRAAGSPKCSASCRTEP